jgi:Ser/Thr protein kinase RdoA (MazF antagonist)
VPFIPDELRGPLFDLGRQVVAACEPAFADLEMVRIHGDCHHGNLLWDGSGPFFLDFDDFLTGPPVQDLWLLSPGRDEQSVATRRVMVDAYRTMRRFDERTLRLVEPLRALRILRYAAWIAHRYADPAFWRAFPDFAQPVYSLPVGRSSWRTCRPRWPEVQSPLHVPLRSLQTQVETQ